MSLSCRRHTDVFSQPLSPTRSRGEKWSRLILCQITISLLRFSISHYRNKRFCFVFFGECAFIHSSLRTPNRTRVFGMWHWSLVPFEVVATLDVEEVTFLPTPSRVPIIYGSIQVWGTFCARSQTNLGEEKVGESLLRQAEKNVVQWSVRRWRQCGANFSRLASSFGVRDSSLKYVVEGFNLECRSRVVVVM